MSGLVTIRSMTRLQLGHQWLLYPLSYCVLYIFAKRLLRNFYSVARNWKIISPCNFTLTGSQNGGKKRTLFWDDFRTWVPFLIAHFPANAAEEMTTINTQHLCVCKAPKCSRENNFSLQNNGHKDQNKLLTTFWTPMERIGRAEQRVPPYNLEQRAFLFRIAAEKGNNHLHKMADTLMGSPRISPNTFYF